MLHLLADTARRTGLERRLANEGIREVVPVASVDISARPDMTWDEHHPARADEGGMQNAQTHLQEIYSNEWARAGHPFETAPFDNIRYTGHSGY